ncbi:U2 small nuclear ribonucleoprotein auxiliary factor 35 kDa subunit-related protein 1 [Belonocnema kinseyi]|uniref:U2 small nuclear ribonucleoprotein auxiliary factor 35 kDa subunit-related protein 1 n=1 Tax=Belonocnema kinseyi TaxID=2817044 RepID=UPI00143E055A|nr:U2 small nuclear ribonucleoprotein auxiliary factor 35 kDa subunit-related protein 1 [Belonocnema kinseyi]
MNTGERRAWRKLVKKERRRRLRRKAAQDRDADAERLKATVERAAEYSTWVQKNREEEIIQEQERIQKEQEWLQEELRAQEEWRSLQERREKARQEKLEQEEMIRKEYEAKQEALRKKQAEEKQRMEEEMKRQQQMQKVIDDYIDEGAKTPPVLRRIVETQPGKDICQFFAKTGACRYGDVCSRNHQKTSLSRVILMPGFYSHYSLEKNSHDTDASLEYDNSEVRQHFEEFYNDVVPELESFGKIKTLKYCSNTELHLRGNLYVEYYSERDAARAVRKLKGRWFARRQINCEFTGIKSWRTAICGMSRCPKGRSCNFLHVFRNPGNEYDVKSPPRWVKRLESQDSARKESRSRRSESRLKSNWDDSTREDVDGNSRNWRWDSPESESDDRRGESTRRRYSDDRHKSSRLSNTTSSRRFRNHEERSCRDLLDLSDEEYHQSSRRNSSGRFRRHKHETRNGDVSRRRRRRESEKSEYGRYSGRSKYSSYSRSDRHGRHKNKSDERDKAEGVLAIGERDLKLRASDAEEESCKISKPIIELNVKSKWDEDTSNPKAESDSSSSASSSPSSSSSSASSSSSSPSPPSGSSKGDLELKVVKRELEAERAVDPEPKRHKVPEYYDWDTTDSEQ